ncbi:glycosyltransferase [uncultured Desulfobacter sp.]|uniref:glycosyltransferase n=1 Tax=uncultured Desulfobacter sp. TaxID=240139 RepID=UPI002AA953EF|nr:glycosyltransferase [uncultured Desulfobacter sp.]
MPVTTSVIIRTYNEERYLDELLRAIAGQKFAEMDVEIVVVDSGSTDSTLEIAERHGCRIENIKKSDFTFGYSLNVGCRAAKGEYLVFVSGHCIPVNGGWLEHLLTPLADGSVAYCYGRQIGRDTTKFSENVHFCKTFPNYDKLPQKGYFCNNANAAITRECWEQYPFDESLTGLEDMHLAKRLAASGRHVGYAAKAEVYHIHDETWTQVLNRYEREAYALQSIAPELHFTRSDFIRFFFSGLFADLSKAVEQRCLRSEFIEIVKFRLYMYWGTYRGSKEHLELSEKMKMAYFYPKDQERKYYDN